MSEKLLCLRCGTSWYQKGIYLPNTCPNCKSFKWKELKPYDDRGPKRKKVPGDPQGIFNH